ncbi:hypothetical protein [Chroococcidiopsis sp.]|uniref:hypothetical protein n=1 Tax=Chroococcidiopsis sp. TaxID=3088168 RepID=UPI003F3C8474
MVWEWSHSYEACENARQNLDLMSHEDLAITLAEISASQWYKVSIGGSCSKDFEHDLYKRRLARHKLRSKDQLSDRIWEIAERMRNCDNGGRRLWMCPFGCHTVSCTLDPLTVVMELAEDLDSLGYPNHAVVAIDSAENDCFVIYHQNNVVSFYTRIDNDTSTHYSSIWEVGHPYRSTYEKYFERNGIEIKELDSENKPYTLTLHDEVEYSLMSWYWSDNND